MWIGKFKIKHDCFILSKLQDGKIKVIAHVLAFHEDNTNFYYSTLMIPIGKEDRIKRFIKEMKADKRVIRTEDMGSQLITHSRVPKKDKHITNEFSRELFLVEPLLHENGYEYWHLASWNREKLIEFYNNSKQVGEVKILKLREEKARDIFYPRIMPKLSSKQKRAFDLAVEFGYYEFPQKIHLQDLAKYMKVSRMTYREHLRKAESKVLPFFASSTAPELDDK